MGVTKIEVKDYTITRNSFWKFWQIDELELNGGCNPCAIKMNNGHLSFPGIDGLIQFRTILN